MRVYMYKYRGSSRDNKTQVDTADSREESEFGWRRVTRLDSRATFGVPTLLVLVLLCCLHVLVIGKAEEHNGYTL
jgi:hypothetical protein